MDNHKPANETSEAESLPNLEEGFWERARRTDTSRRNFFWLVMGIIAAILFFSNGGPVLFTPQ